MDARTEELKGPGPSWPPLPRPMVLRPSITGHSDSVDYSDIPATMTDDIAPTVS